MAIDKTGPEPDIKERARQLRREGMSVKQIVAELGLTSTHIVQDWVQGVPPPAWTRRPRAKDAERARARELRSQGLTYDEIAKELKVSKSSISLWTRDLPASRARSDEPAALAWRASDATTSSGVGGTTRSGAATSSR